MLENLVSNIDYLFAVAGLIYAVAGFGFVVGRFSANVMFNEFTFRDFKDACLQLANWVMVVYKLNKQRKINRAYLRGEGQDYDERM